MRQPISAVIISFNEEHTIARCLESVKWMDEVIVVDSGSTDGTVEICRQFGVNLLEAEWLGFGRTKQYAVEQARHDWIFSIDCDEEMTPVLRERIEEILAQPEQKNGYYVKRRSYYLTRLIKYSGWERDYPQRLFNRQHGTFNAKEVHESVRIPEPKGYIEEHLLHYSYPTIESHVAKINRYTSLGAEQLAEKGKSATPLSAFGRGLTKFFKMYLLQRGFLDGVEGFILAVISSFGVYLKYLKLWQITR